MLQDRPSHEQHLVLVQMPRGPWPDLPDGGTTIVRGMRALLHYPRLAWHASTADRIFLHGLFTPAPMAALLLLPWVWRRLYWVVWGGDLYAGRRRRVGWPLVLTHLIRRLLTARIMHLVTYIPGDVAYSRRHHAACARMHPCLMYTSNTPLPATSATLQVDSRPHLLLGNSADPANGHASLLRLAARHRNAIDRVTIPLSYGQKDHACAVAALAGRMFGSSCRILTGFMPLEEYLALLDSVDIAVFNHREQQAMGNTIHLLSRGKQVYLRRNTSQWQLFTSLGIKVGATEDFDPRGRIDTTVNPGIVHRLFNREQLVRQWADLFATTEDSAQP